MNWVITGGLIWHQGKIPSNNARKTRWCRIWHHTLVTGLQRPYGVIYGTNGKLKGSVSRLASPRLLRPLNSPDAYSVVVFADMFSQLWYFPFSIDIFLRTWSETGRTLNAFHWSSSYLSVPHSWNVLRDNNKTYFIVDYLEKLACPSQFLVDECPRISQICVFSFDNVILWLASSWTSAANRHCFIRHSPLMH